MAIHVGPTWMRGWWFHISGVLMKYLFRMDRRVTGHFGHKTLRHQDTLGHFDAKHVVRDTSTRHECRDRGKAGTLWTQDNSDVTQLHRWLVLNFGTNFWCRSVSVPKCLVAEVSGSRYRTDHQDGVAYCITVWSISWRDAVYRRTEWYSLFQLIGGNLVRERYARVGCI